MKCPYRDFQECIIQDCPCCVFEVEENEQINGLFQVV